jgi:hypothetical protein
MVFGVSGARTFWSACRYWCHYRTRLSGSSALPRPLKSIFYFSQRTCYRHRNNVFANRQTMSLFAATRATFSRPSLGVSVLCVLLAGCSVGPQPSPSLYERLSGRGPVLVATENQYLPANRLLAEHVQSSEVFREQIAMMGQPDALRVERGLFSPTQVVLYYVAQNQQVAFAKRGSEWVREEPMLIDSEERAKILGEDTEVPAEAVVEDVPTAMLPSIIEAPIEFKARMSPAMLSHREAQLKALKNGDYKHTVTFSGETLTLLADWYTGKPSNAANLAKASSRPVARRLAKGDVIVIPQRLMRNATALPEAALK